MSMGFPAPMTRLYVVRIDIFEPSAPYPVVSHLFYGRTPEEARGNHAAHLQADAFLRACEEEGVYRGNVRCTARTTEGWV
jgi:hypothetical protein